MAGMADVTVRAALLELDAWASLRERLEASRDETVARALEAGVSKTDVHRRTGIARTTIDRIAAAAGVLSPRQADAEAALEQLRRKLAGDVD